MATQIWVNPERFRKVGRHVLVDGMDVHVSVSPWDAPTKISGVYRPVLKQFEIRFDYMDQEVDGKSFVKEGITFVEGKYSGKLLALLIPVDGRLLDQDGLVHLRTRVTDALASRSSSLDPSKDANLAYGQYLNSEVARDLLDCDEGFEMVARELVSA